MSASAGSRRLLTGFSLAVLLCAPACFHSDFRTKPRVAVVGGDPIVQMTAAGSLASLENPHASPLSRHTDPPAPWEPVVALRTADGGRAYPLGLLDTYEVVNDGPPGAEYVVTRCPLAQIAAVYDRHVAGRTLTFVNSGALWRDTLVIEDRETGTLWTVATGQAIYGPLAGERLTPIPAILATSRAWSEACPDTRYLDTGESTETPVTLSLYALSSWEGVSGVKTLDRRYKPKATLYSVSDGRQALAFTESDLKGQGCLERRLGPATILLEWDAADDAPRAYLEGSGQSERLELAVVPMYWFALDRHFETVHTLSGGSGAP